MKSKYFIIICLLVLIGSISNPAYAAEPSSAESLGQKINDLKERIASRVAQLKLVERRGIIGNVTDVSNTQITITDIQNNTRFIDVDEITKFSSPAARGSFGISDIPKGTTIGVLGLYNKESRRTLARFVTVLINPSILHGAILKVDANDYSFTMLTPDKTTYIVDIEKTTRTQIYSKDNGLTKAGFIRIKEGQRVTVLGYPNAKIKNRISGAKVIIFQELPKNPKIGLSLPSITPEQSSAPEPTNVKNIKQ